TFPPRRKLRGFFCLTRTNRGSNRVSMAQTLSRVLSDSNSGPTYPYGKYLKIQEVLGNNAMMKAKAHNKAGPAREGDALLQGSVRCGRCGRGMYVGYGGHRSGRAHRTMQYRCSESRNQIGGTDCQTIGGKRIDQAVVVAFIDAIAPAGHEALKRIEEQVQADHHALEHSWALQLEKAEYEAQRAERQFQAVEPENRLVAR